MLFEFGIKVELEDFVDEMVSGFGKKNCKTEKYSQKIGDKTYQGTRVNVSLAGSKLVTDLLNFEIGDKSMFIVFQDSLTEEEEPSKEGIETLKMLSKTIKEK